MNLVAVTGYVTNIMKPEHEKGSGLIAVQYGNQRQRTDRPVNFVNAVSIRIPHFRWDKVSDKLERGVEVEVTAHLQGVLKSSMMGHVLVTEIVADRITVIEYEDEDEADDSKSPRASGVKAE